MRQKRLQLWRASGFRSCLPCLRATTVTDDSHFHGPLRCTARSRRYRGSEASAAHAKVAHRVSQSLHWRRLCIDNKSHRAAAVLVYQEGKAWKALLVFGSLFAVFALINLFQGMWQLHHALNPRAKKTAVPAASKFTAAQSRALPGVESRASVTEGATKF